MERNGSAAGLTPALRTTRSGVFAGCAVLLAALAHVAGGGQAPPALLGGGLALALGLAFRLLPVRPVRPAIAIAGLGAAQVFLHTAFMALIPGGESCTPAAAGHHDPGMADVACHAAGDPMAGAAPGGAGMIAAHAVAVVLLALLIARGERAAWYLLTWMLPTLGIALRVATAVVRPGLAPWPEQPAPARARVAAGVRRRGPPHLLSL